MIEVVVEGIRVSPQNNKRVVMLREKHGRRYLPIWVGHFEADGIAIFTQKVPVARPLTHDFARALIGELGGTLRHAAIVRLEHETYYATVAVERDGRTLELDARPSDAISVALRADAPILVDEALPLAELPEADGDGPAATPQERLVGRLMRDGAIRSAGVEAAFRAVPRHAFLPDEPLDRAYSDVAVATKVLYGRAVSSASQPSLVAAMLEDLDLGPGQRVLEIGAGTGYNAALMARIVGEAGRVVTVDIDGEMAEYARRHLEDVGLGPDRVSVVVADGVAGFPEAAPFDRIVVTVGTWDIAPAWRGQLGPEGRLVLPLSIGGAEYVVAFRPDDGHLRSTSVRRSGFVPLRGPSAPPRRRVPLGPDPALYLETDTPDMVDGDAVLELLRGPSRDRPTGVRAAPQELQGGLLLWLAAHEPGLALLGATAATPEGVTIPRLAAPAGPDSRQTTWMLVGDGALAALARPAGQEGSARPPSPEAPFEVVVRGFGADEALTERLAGLVLGWEGADRPAADRVQIRALPGGAAGEAVRGRAIIRRRWSDLALDWA